MLFVGSGAGTINIEAHRAFLAHVYPHQQLTSSSPPRMDLPKLSHLQCGCYCLRCCSTNGSRQYTCRNNTEGAACRFYEDCEEYDESRCGLGYSTAAQAMYCPVPQPSTWPALMQIPRTARRAEPWRPAAAMLYTGDERGASEQLANELFIDPAPSPAEEGAAAATFQEGLAVVSQPFWWKRGEVGGWGEAALAAHSCWSSKPDQPR